MSDKFKQLEEVIEQEDVQVVFQPLVDLRTKELFAYEALHELKAHTLVGHLKCSRLRSRWGEPVSLVDWYES